MNLGNFFGGTISGNPVSSAQIVEYSSLTILPGFIAQSHTGEQTTLGRGGSDYTAAIIANALDVDILEIWTDVSGMFTTNPKMVKAALPIKKISYEEAVELSHFGAKVLYPPTVQPVLDKKIPIVIKNTLKPEDEGTLITTKESSASTSPVKGISNIELGSIPICISYHIWTLVEIAKLSIGLLCMFFWSNFQN